MVSLNKEIYKAGSKVTFIANGELQIFELEADGSLDMVIEEIGYFFEAYRIDSLCINGINVIYPNIKSGYAIVEGRMANMLLKHGQETYFSLGNMKQIMKLGIRAGDTFHLKGISSFRISSVDYGDRILCLTLE